MSKVQDKPGGSGRRAGRPLPSLTPLNAYPQPVCGPSQSAADLQDQGVILGRVCVVCVVCVCVCPLLGDRRPS